MTTLRDLRLQNKKTATEVAGVLGVSESAVSNYEKGIRTIGLEMVLALAQLYECTEKEVIQAQLSSVEVGKSNKIIRRNV